jgi:hypothetical protein
VVVRDLLVFGAMVSLFKYDALGRQAKETRADGTTTTTNYEWWKTDANQSDAGIVYKVTTTTSGSFKVWQGCLLNST